MKWLWFLLSFASGFLFTASHGLKYIVFSIVDGVSSPQSAQQQKNSHVRRGNSDAQSSDPQLAQIVENAFDFLDKSNSNCADHAAFKCFMYFRKEVRSYVSNELTKKITNKGFNIEYTVKDSLINNNIAQQELISERVTLILHALNHTLEHIGELNGLDVLLSASFSLGSYPLATKHLTKIFDKASSSKLDKHFFMLEKNSKLSSLSDWHDLMIVSMLLHPDTKLFISKLYSIYLQYADRPVYQLFAPRAAILETSVQLIKKIGIGYLGPSLICVQKSNIDNELRIHEHGAHTSYCHNNEEIGLEIVCKGPAANDIHSCSTIHQPRGWQSLLRNLDKKRFQDKFGEFSRLAERYEDGTFRFRFSPNVDRPLDYCWDVGTTNPENPVTALIYTNGVGVPYEKPPDGTFGRPRKFTVFDASSGDPNELIHNMEFDLTKLYYCKQHGYKFAHKLSNEYAHYLGPRFIADIRKAEFSSDGPYLLNVFSKIPMLLSEMFEDLESDWILWTDYDTWINPEWLHLPLDAFVYDVPDDRALILGNFRSAFTNAFFIRNNFKGREIVIDLLAIIESGFIQCHGFDQAAVGTLLLSRMLNQNVPKDYAPYNHTCLNSKWLAKETSKLPPGFKDRFDGVKRKYPNFHWGCDSGADWSCDFEYEMTLNRLGFKSRNGYFHEPVSSVSKGCANHRIPDYFVSFENIYRPRFHCDYCDYIDEIGSSYFTYDGPLGSGNDWVRQGAINSWFINHKVKYPMYEAYANATACQKVDDFVPPCSEKSMVSFMKIIKNQQLAKEEHAYYHNGRQLISIVDGYAFSLELESFCRVSGDMLNYQKENTYMKDYASTIQELKKIPVEKWVADSDAAKKKEERQHRNKRGSYFEEKDFCQKCKDIVVPEYNGDPSGEHKVTNC